MRASREFVKWHTQKKENEVKEFPTKWSTCKITPGFYASINDIIAAVNNVINETVKYKNFFEYDSSSQRIKVKHGDIHEGEKMILSFKMSSRLALQFGYQPEKEIEADTNYAPHVANVASGIPDRMLVYCDILEPQIIGDSWARVLRTVNTSQDGVTFYFAKSCNFDFTHRQYLPLQKKYFESVSIDIRDITGSLMPFQYGTLSAKLHFKKV